MQPCFLCRGTIVQRAMRPDILVFQAPPFNEHLSLFQGVEDLVVETTCEILKALGYSVLTACSGEQALEVYRSAKDRIDLVLLGFMMPGMKGDETFRQLKSIDPEARVVLMSGYNIEKELEAILSLGFDGFLKKPFKVCDLTKALRSVLEKSA